MVWVARDGSTTPVDSTVRRVTIGAVPSPTGRLVALRIQEAERIDLWVKELPRGPAVRITHVHSTNPGAGRSMPTTSSPPSSA